MNIRLQLQKSTLVLLSLRHAIDAFNEAPNHTTTITLCEVASHALTHLSACRMMRNGRAMGLDLHTDLGETIEHLAEYLKHVGEFLDFDLT